MPQATFKSPKMKCPVCGEIAIVRSLRGAKPETHSRICESKTRYKKRFVGMRSSNQDRSKFE